MTNNLSFFIDSKDNIIKCEYIENSNVFKQGIITLPQQKLKNLLFSLLHKYKKKIINKNKNLSIISFNNINIYALHQIIQESNNYKNMINKKKNDYNRKKVVRKNKFKKTIISTSAAILVILTAYAHINELQMQPYPENKNPKDEINYSEDLDYDLYDEENNQYPIDNEQSNLNISNVSHNENNNNENSNSSNEIIPDVILSLNAEDWINTEKYLIAKSYYFETISKTAKTYGIDPNLALAICTHERGIHSNTVDSGGAIGLFQIQVEGKWNWVGKEITAYNFDTNSYETVTITKEGVSDVFENIKVGCMMIQDLLVRNDYNVLKAVTEYNYGISNLKAVLDRCSYETGFETEDLNDMENLEWLNYRDIISGGDPEYLENVFKYIPDGTILSFKMPNQKQINIKYTNSNSLNYHI